MARRSDDTTLIRLVRRGDREAMARLCETYWSVAWKGAYAVLLDRTLSDDATQEAMLRVLRALDTFDETRPLAPWIRRIAVNQALDLLRRDRRLVSVPDAPEDAVRHAWSDDANELHIAAAEAVAALPRRGASSPFSTTGSTTASWRSRTCSDYRSARSCRESAEPAPSSETR
jgi:RNA polymerase sigma factor (sigma-70 family)